MHELPKWELRATLVKFLQALLRALRDLRGFSLRKQT